MCLREHTSSSCAVALHRSWILLVVAWSLLVTSWTWTLSSNGPNLDNQSASCLIDPLIYLILKSYDKVLITRHWCLGVACIRLLTSTFSSGFWTYPWPKQLQSLKLNYNIHILMWLETLAGKVDCLTFLKETCTKLCQACICLQSEGLSGVIMLDYWCTVDFFLNALIWLALSYFVAFDHQM